MKHFFNLFLALLLTSSFLLAQDVFHRTSEIPTLQYETGGGGFGSIVAGVDFDDDGKPEIYAINTNMIDRDGELVPRVYKFEYDEFSSTWEEVWSAVAPLDFQNTWPGFTFGDVDKDGRPELYWAPANYSPYPEVARILVYEYAGDGTDNMGVSDGFGGFSPNASTPIISGDGVNLRPIKLMVRDVDDDGTDEIIFCDRVGDYHYGILSVDDIPDAGGGTETWTVEAMGDLDANIPSGSSNYDFNIIGNIIYLFNGDGSVSPVKYTNNAWAALPVQNNIGDNYGSFKGSVTADLDGDGTDEIILGGWDNPTKVFVLKQVADTLQSFDISDASINVQTLNGAAAGDLDNDGNWDFVFGTRGSPASVPNNAMLRVEFQGGDITDPANYITSIIDSMLVPNDDNAGGQIDVVAMGNIDGDDEDELLYTQGYTRGVANDTTANLAIVELAHTPLSVEVADLNVPEELYLNQNYPNPFNPSTTIKFGLTNEMSVELRVYNVLGQEVMTLINKDIMSAGSYNVTFDASSLASGTYIYRLIAGDFAISKKMQLIK